MRKKSNIPLICENIIVKKKLGRKNFECWGFDAVNVGILISLIALLVKIWGLFFLHKLITSPKNCQSLINLIYILLFSFYIHHYPDTFFWG